MQQALLLPVYLWFRAIKKVTLFVKCPKIDEWLLEMSQRSSFSQGSSAVLCSSSFNYSCAEKANWVRVFSVCLFALTGRTYLFSFYLKTSWKELMSSSCQRAFNTCQAYNISAPKTNHLESFYLLLLASQLQLSCKEQILQTITGGETKCHLMCLAVTAV